MSLHAPHWAYVIGAYAASGMGLGALVVSSAIRAKVWRRRAAAREAAGRNGPARPAP